MEAYRVCAVMKLFGMLMVFKLVGHVLVVIAVLLYLVNECLVVCWSALWRLIKIDYLDFTWRLSPRRRCPRRMCPRRMTPRRMTPRRMSPRRKAETDIPETGGTDWCRRRMALGGKAWTEGSFVFMAFRPRDILLCHWYWPSQSRRRMAPRRMSPRRRKAAWDGCPRDGGRPPETDVTDMDVPDTEGVLFQALRPIWENVTASSFFTWVYGSSDIECLQCCVYVVCAVVAEWFRRQTNMGPPVSVMRAVLCWCGFRSLVAEWFRRQPNLRPAGSW